MPPYDVNLMYIKVVELKSAYFLIKNQFKIHLNKFRETFKIKTFTIKNVSKCIKNVCD